MEQGAQRVPFRLSEIKAAMTGKKPSDSNRTTSSSFKPTIINWGTLPYREAHQRQLAALEDRIAGRIGDTIFLVEHPHIYTYGRGADLSRFIPPIPVDSDQPIETVFVERGGDVTYHGPGQLVAYPIVDVRALTGDLHRFLYWLEEAIIRTIAHWGIEGRHHPEHTGVWVGERKIASIGVAVRKWISYHGLALNVTTDLRYFSAIEPCGLPAAVMTSMTGVTGSTIVLAEVAAAFSTAVREA